MKNNREIQPSSVSDILGSQFTLLPNALIVNGKPLIEAYDNAFRQLSSIESATSWWWGDLANARERDYGSLKELAERLEVNYNSLFQYQRVAKAYELCMRIQSLSFNHHQIAAPLDDRADWLKLTVEKEWSVRELKIEILKSQIEIAKFNGTKPTITRESYNVWLPKQPQCDLLLTDPPYSTDIDAPIEEFAAWLPTALDKVKPSGRAYVFIGPYPREIKAYLSAIGDKIDSSQLLIWEYRNTMGPSPTHNYKNNWQAIIYYKGREASELNCPLLLEQYSVQQFSMPNAKDNPLHNTWEKPLELAELFIRHSTKEGDLVLDPFAGSGTFLVAAANFGRVGLGCDIDQNIIDVAQLRGCEIGI